MKKTLGLLVFLMLFVGLFFTQPAAPGYAQGEVPPTPTPTPRPGEFDFITFKMLDIQDEVLLGPYANSYIRFSTPDSWALQPGAKLVLEVDTTVRSSRVFQDVASEYSGALLEVTFNDHVIDTIFLPKGQKTLSVTIPKEALNPTQTDGRHSLQIYLDATIDCLFDHETSVLIRSVSGFLLPHLAASPTPSLTLLPRPIYKPDSVLPEDVIILIPDQPSTHELQSAMIVAASLGRMTRGEQALSLASVSSLAQEERDNANIVMVGKSDSLPPLASVTFPVGHNAEPLEGIVQMAVSPWNTSRVVLYIGGAEDDAVVKAAQAFSSGSLRTGKHYSLSVIKKVSEAIESKDVANDRTFKSLGYTTQILSGVGYNSFDYEFLIPLGKAPAGESKFDLLFTHSTAFNFDASSTVVLLNNQPLGSVSFSDETANELNTLTMSIPAYALQPGRNVLTVLTEFIPADHCATLTDTSLWMSVSEDSLLRIPLVDADENLATFVRDLGMYPVPFTDSPSLSQTSFIFPASDVASWNLGAKIAANLGQDVVGKTLNLSAFYADEIPEEARLNNHLMIIGRASQLPVINDLKESMPAHFESDSDMAVEDDSLITFSIPEGTDLGYLELFTSPWSSARSVMTVMGSTPLGLTWAGNALLNRDLKSEIQGDYVVVQANQIYSIDTKESGLGTQNLSATAVPGTPPTLIPDNVPITTHAYQRDWVKIAILVTSVLTILLLLGIFARKVIKK